ncbi:MAG: hypothetical protein A2158_03105 [Chloroflexi bacterium RBG_13_46_14]|nr:MAG: hypothetical protein A2158_03105 [Chloroflexi bacterium RBG_13_46_14]
MPAKSRRKRGKNLPPNKRIKQSGGSTTAAVASQSTVNTVNSAAAVETPVVSGKKTTSQVQTAAVRHPYIMSELTTIGILAVLILVILGILAAVL